MIPWTVSSVLPPFPPPCHPFFSNNALMTFTFTTGNQISRHIGGTTKIQIHLRLESAVILRLRCSLFHSPLFVFLNTAAQRRHNMFFGGDPFEHFAQHGHGGGGGSSRRSARADVDTTKLYEVLGVRKNKRGQHCRATCST